MIKQTVLPFKIEETKDLITAHAGLALLGEFAVGLGLLDALNRTLGTPGSGVGYRASEHVMPLILMLNGGGRSLEDLRQIRKPSTHAVWNSLHTFIKNFKPMPSVDCPKNMRILGILSESMDL